MHATVPADAPRQLLKDAADALLRWGVAAANYTNQTGETVSKLDDMAAELAAAALAGPEQLFSDLRRTDRRIQSIGEESASFALRWKRDRLAVLLLATTPSANVHPETQNPFAGWDPNYNAPKRNLSALLAK